ncbi:minichromosome maintenance protein 4 [Dunaliella salina]|uniref:DNA helicase n=1 Tax=Dunaliella salina TaxID=3046 RepID=A0ABQ7H9R8_DUNSA|nr:minichromosome maintenance protein 4 [Dunaliella salina]|eukprot:KAF5843598.1 minichromosome maintenance protein 4 [Dunaliella salina]
MPPRKRSSASQAEQGSGEPSPGVSRRTTRSGRNSQGNSPSVAPLPSEQQEGSQGNAQMEVDNNNPGTQQQGRGTPTRSARSTPGRSATPRGGRGGQGGAGQSPTRTGTPTGGRGRGHSSNGPPPEQGTPGASAGGGPERGSNRGAPSGAMLPPGLGTPSSGHRLGRADLGGIQRNLPLRPLPPDLMTHSDSVAPVDEPDGEGFDNTVIWGTSISVAATERAARQFLEGFTPEDEMGEETQSKYSKLIAQAIENGENVVNLDTADLRAWDQMQHSKLYKDLVMYPREVMPIFDSVATNMAAENLGTQENVPDIQVKVYNLDRARTIRDLNPEDIDTLVSVQGMVTRTSPIIPDLRTALFRCERCAHGHEMVCENGRVPEPEQCRGCGAKWACTLIHNMSTFTNKQMVKMQEKPNDIPEGETPHNVTMYVYESNVDICRPGDRVTITGTYRAQRDEQGRLFTLAAAQQEAAAADASQEQASQGEHGLSSVPPTGSQGPTQQETQDPFLMDDDQNQFVRLGATTNEQVGDPSVSKSQLLSYVHALAPRGIYTSGKGSSAVGLTAYISKDPETKELVLESGALVLSDRGVCCIDEFDKMSDGARSMLHEAMEQQTVSVAKAGLISTLNARTSVCACANPIGSRYNPNLTVAENIHLPPTLLTRFDLIYLLLDKFEEEKDLRLARHLISLYHPGATTAARPPDSVEPLPIETLRDYIAFARARVRPTLDEAAAAKLASVYMEMRREGMSRKMRRMTLTWRLYIRVLVHAAAKQPGTCRRSCSNQDYRIVPLHVFGADEGGDIDLEALHTGVSARSRQAARDLPEKLQQMLAAHPGRRVSLTDLLETLAPMGITREQLVTALKTSLQPFVSFNERLGTVESRGAGSTGGVANDVQG